MLILDSACVFRTQTHTRISTRSFDSDKTPAVSKLNATPAEGGATFVFDTGIQPPQDTNF